jgi:hypothetical protein
MEGWRQGRLGSKQELTGWKRRRKTFLQEGRRKTYLTLTGLLMEGLGFCNQGWKRRRETDSLVKQLVTS